MNTRLHPTSLQVRSPTTHMTICVFEFEQECAFLARHRTRSRQSLQNVTIKLERSTENPRNLTTCHPTSPDDAISTIPLIFFSHQIEGNDRTARQYIHSSPERPPNISNNGHLRIPFRIHLPPFPAVPNHSPAAKSNKDAYN